MTVDPFENESAVDNELLLAPPETVVPPLAVMVPECPSPLYVTTYVAVSYTHLTLPTKA